MTMIIRKTYKQGDSTGITIPKNYGVRPGIHLTSKHLKTHATTGTPDGRKTHARPHLFAAPLLYVFFAFPVFRRVHHRLRGMDQMHQVTPRRVPRRFRPGWPAPGVGAAWMLWLKGDRRHGSRGHRGIEAKTYSQVLL